ncbi:MAG TPA: bifunctional alpha,alpha-trehalose-phosphate synthase (UDP-forming)/trehalose-phosphatase [Prolixibacteraceae bacterium]|nr:bifunctional alpha,alpha-trehalose-phosphate synthase (UDP-forming)/trehalose-phosphatase [Prolixibacteraceae bacterium]
MQKLLIVSNRLPVNVDTTGDEIRIIPSVGGLATGMSSVSGSYRNLWIGWSGLTKGQTDEKTEKAIEKELIAENYLPLHLSQEDLDGFYFGFSNRTIWPLFHYFTQYVQYDDNDWETYKRVNQIYADAIIEAASDEDMIWIHDYQLMLVPQMVKEQKPDMKIGFFLHIPFPSFEIFRILPWRKEIIEGLLGSDLIGFHTFDYQRHFLSTVRRLLGLEVNFNEISYGHRIIKTDIFPMGIDYGKFHGAAIEQKVRAVKDKTKVQKEMEKYILTNPEIRLIISIDRLDYSKGIEKRLQAIDYFMDHHPEYLEKITLIMITVPSRSEVPQYKQMKSEVDELVGRINGKFGTINWTPIWYFYRSFPFEELVDLYSTSDIALVTPNRDGMNLVAKEYIATKTDKKGVLILSEMAGAAREMGEAILVNPNNMKELSDAILTAIEMGDDEMILRNSLLQDRLQRYDVKKWASEFLKALTKATDNRPALGGTKIIPKVEADIVGQFRNAKSRILFLDYDGTLVGFKNNPKKASPDVDLMQTLEAIAGQANTELVLISGRDKETFDQWFPDKPFSMVTEHGVWSKKPDQPEWELLEYISSEWKTLVRPVLDFFADRTPGTFIEEKNYSLVWHYRNTDQELGMQRAIELKDELNSLLSNFNLEIMEGNKVIEVKNSGINKGKAAARFLRNKDYEFILAAGDDWTDEFLFQELPQETISIKVGAAKTRARYSYADFRNMRNLLNQLATE